MEMAAIAKRCQSDSAKVIMNILTRLRTNKHYMLAVWHLFAEGRLFNFTCTHPHIHTHAHTHTRYFPSLLPQQTPLLLLPSTHTHVYSHNICMYIALHPNRHLRVRPSSWGPSLPWKTDHCDQCGHGTICNRSILCKQIGMVPSTYTDTQVQGRAITWELQPT